MRTIPKNRVLLEVTIRKSAKNMLVNRSEATGRSMSELTEFAIINIPFIPSKNVKTNIIRGKKV